MAYIVKNMTLIPQALRSSCWYASAQMLITWKQDQRQQSMKGLIPPDLDAECRKIRDDNKGMVNKQILTMAFRLGLEAIPPMTPTTATIEYWLTRYGPLWVNGKTHIVVIAGIMDIPILGVCLLIYDPWPVCIGKIDWRSISWYLGSGKSSRDTRQNVETVFLHCKENY